MGSDRCAGEDLGGDEAGETIIRLYCMKNLLEHYEKLLSHRAQF